MHRCYVELSPLPQRLGLTGIERGTQHPLRRREVWQAYTFGMKWFVTMHPDFMFSNKSIVRSHDLVGIPPEHPNMCVGWVGVGVGVGGFIPVIGFLKGFRQTSFRTGSNNPSVTCTLSQLNEHLATRSIVWNIYTLLTVLQSDRLSS